MKSISIIVLLILGMSFITWNMVSCNSKKTTTEYTKHPPDTTQTFVNIVTPVQWQQYGITGNQSVTTIAWRLTKDTFLISDEDKKKVVRSIGLEDSAAFMEALKKYAKWGRDTVYAFEVHLPKKDTTAGKKDSVIYPLLTTRFVLFDYNRNPNKP